MQKKDSFVSVPSTREYTTMKKMTWLCVLLLILPLAVRAQETSNWEVVVYADGANALQVLTADGVSRTIPAGTLPLHVGTFPSAPLVALSPDRRVMAALNFRPGQRLSLSIASGGSCCATVRLSQYGVAEANIGSFSPDEHLIAVSYLAPIDAAALQYEAAIITVNVDQGIAISRLDGTRFGGDYALLRGWDADGIEYQPICRTCVLPPSGEVMRWDPVADVVTPNVGSYDSAQDTLALTGETIIPARRPDFPLPLQGGSSPNVVTMSDDARVIYYNPNDLQVNAAHWVADGWQILVEQPSGDVLLDRAEMKTPITVDDQFLVGTPDGWLGTRAVADALEVVHHTLTDIAGSDIARFYHPITVLQSTPLGATASRGGFGGAASPVSRITCPNGLPPRLVAGGQGRTVGGVNLRSTPALTANIITQITTQVFDVVSGPNCDPTGVVWWQVKIGGLQGWVAESQNGQYLLQPVQN